MHALQLQPRQSTKSFQTHRTVKCPSEHLRDSHTHMSIKWESFAEYRDGYNENIYYNNKRRIVLDALLERYDEYQVVSSKQVADWSDSTTKKLAGNNVWDLFPRYGLVALVQKIENKSQSNRLLVVPIFRWLAQWDGSPSLAPSADSSVQDLGPTREQLSEQQAREATEALSYVIERLDATEIPDPKEAIVWGKAAASGAISAAIPQATVTITKVADEDHNQPSAYDALDVTGQVGGEGFEIHDREQAERALRPVMYLFALAGCYSQRAARANADRSDDYVPAAVAEHSDVDDSEAPGVGATTPAFSPYVINKQNLIADSDPPTFSRDEESGALTFQFRLGPMYTYFTEDQ